MVTLCRLDLRTGERRRGGKGRTLASCEKRTCSNPKIEEGRRQNCSAAARALEEEGKFL